MPDLFYVVNQFITLCIYKGGGGGGGGECCNLYFIWKLCWLISSLCFCLLAAFYLEKRDSESALPCLQISASS